METRKENTKSEVGHMSGTESILFLTCGFLNCNYHRSLISNRLPTGQLKYSHSFSKRFASIR